MTDQVTTEPPEREFGHDELFFSTTDAGGRIQTGNPVFARVSGWSAEELVGKAHNIVRHPDMPRVVFRLLWSYLAEGRPIAAYVKNRARDGRPYWVVATVVPIDGGFLSVRFKPSGPHFPVVRDLYAELRAVEASVEDAGGRRDEAMDAAAERLGAALTGLGLADYDALMHRFMDAELASRDALLADSPTWGDLWARPVPPTSDDPHHAALVRTLQGFRGAYDRMAVLSADVAEYSRLNETLAGRSRDLVGEMRIQSLNMLLSAARLGDQGASLGMVARLMADESEGAAVLTDELNTRSDGLDAVLRDLSFRIGVGRLQAEMAVFFANELLREPAGADARGGAAENVRLLADALAGSVRAVGEIAAGLEHGLVGMESDMTAFTRLLRVLEVLQLNGTIEASRSDGTQAAHQLLSEMRDRVLTARSELEGLTKAARTARVRAHRSRRDEEVAVREIDAVREVAATLTEE